MGEKIPRKTDWALFECTFWNKLEAGVCNGIKSVSKLSQLDKEFSGDPLGRPKSLKLPDGRLTCVEQDTFRYLSRLHFRILNRLLGSVPFSDEGRLIIRELSSHQMKKLKGFKISEDVQEHRTDGIVPTFLQRMNSLVISWFIGQLRASTGLEHVFQSGWRLE